MTGRTPTPPHASRTPPAPTPAQLAKRFRLSAIMGGPEGNIALINDKLVKAGQHIEDALVVKVGPHFVELDVAGQQCTLRL